MNQHRNPIDFMPRSYYAEIDRQAAQDRRFRFAFKVAFVLAVFLGMAGLVYILKR